MDLIGRREGVGLGGKPLPRIRSPTTSLVKETRIIGRDDIKEPIVNLLLSNDAKGNEHLCVIPIAGMGGIGKTTLAQLIYNDQRITEHISISFWVCVSEEFDVVRITKSILEAVTSQKCDTTDFMIQTRLKKGLMGKKFLLVLDDVWNENYGDWELLKNPFKHGTLGSKIIVTTRNEDCWCLFTNHAFENGNYNAYPELDKIGRKIIKKCDGLPLAAKALGALLHRKLDEEEWYKILNSKIWSLPNDGVIFFQL
ncbi:putative disease resistance RPP13-like protein 1 [Castanea sativa]|uniref:putative disease resistance RPP13-like protein 1 n=1 Tax=Castanea sativa TaxID=21020 RepID=UPI003F653776